MKKTKLFMILTIIDGVQSRPLGEWPTDPNKE